MPTEFLGIARSLEAGELTLEQALTIVGRAVDSPDLRSMHSHAKQSGDGSISHSHVGDISGTHAHSGMMPRAAKRDGEITSDGRAPYSAKPGETVKCPSCGKMNEPDAKFCDQCGAKLPASGKTEAEHDAIDEADARRLLADIA
jgi:membrane protease subunit (stomatin/prohibitin family)